MNTSEITLVRPYSGKINPNPRQQKFLDDSFAYLEEMTELFYDLSQAICGACEGATIEKHLYEKKEELEAAEAIFLFHVVGKDTKHKDCTVPADELLSRFEKYTAGTLSLAARHYLTSKIDTTKYCWQDNRQLASKYAKKLGITFKDFVDFSRAVISNNVFIQTASDKAAANFISKIIGEGKKADNASRLRILHDANIALAKAAATNHAELRDVIVQGCGAISVDALLKDFGAMGSKTSFQRLFDTHPAQSLDEKNFKAICNKLKKDEETYINKVEIPHASKVKELILGVSNKYCVFHSKPALEACKLALADIKSKTSNNLNVIEEKSQLYAAFEPLEKVTGVQEVIQILERHMNTLPERYAPYRHSFGNLEGFLNNLQSGMAIQEAIDTCVEEINDRFSRKPDRNWLAVLAPHHQTLSVTNIESAISCLFKKQRYEYRKPFPFVKTNACCTWGPFNIPGEINSPHMELRGRFCGSSSDMWITAFMLDGRQWKNHHFRFSSSRFFRDIYFSDPSLPTRKEPRNTKFGFQLKSSLNEESVALVRNAGKKHRAVKTIERIKTHATHNVDWQAPSFQIQRVGTGYRIMINSRIMAPKLPCLSKKEDLYVVYPHLLHSQLKVGDRILAQDMNQTAATANTIYEVVEGDQGAIKWQGMNLKLVDDAHFEMPLKSKQGMHIDVLSYAGVHESKSESGFKAFKNSCRIFVKTSGTEDHLRLFDNRADKKSSLYPFIASHMEVLIKMMRDTPKEKYSLVFRDHLHKLFFDSGNLSPLRTHGLSVTGLSATKKCMNTITTYFSQLGKDLTDVMRMQFDRTLFEARNKLSTSLTNRRKERTRLEAHLTMKLVHKYGVRAVVFEADLPSMATGASRQQNSARLDWCAKQAAKLKIQSLNCAGIYACAVNPSYTSHVNPFHNDLRARFASVRKGELAMYQLNGLKKMLKSKSESKTGKAYLSAAKQFCLSHGILPEEVLKMAYPNQLESRINQQSYLIPQRGGRVFISSLPVTKDAVSCSVEIYGKGQYECNADLVAAVNILSRVRVKASSVN